MSIETLNLNFDEISAFVRWDAPTHVATCSYFPEAVVAALCEMATVTIGC